MKVTLLVTADYASVEPSTGKLNILGVFSRVATKQNFPMTLQRMAVALRMRAELTDHHDEREVKLELLDEDAGQHLQATLPFRFPISGTGMPGDHSVVVELNGLKFPHPGFYDFVVSVDGEKLDSTPIEIIKLP